MSEIRFSIETIYSEENNDDYDSSNDYDSIDLFSSQILHAMGDFVDSDSLNSLETFIMISQRLDLENTIINMALRQSEQDCELRRDTSKCIEIVSRKFDENIDFDNQCSICISKFVAEQDLVTLPCKHTFHKKCIEEWGHYKPECPLCKKSIPLVKENLADNKDGMEESNTNME